MQVEADDVLEVLPNSLTAGPKSDVSYREINVIGLRAQVDRVRIVHGHGMGILKRAVADLLAHNPHVARFHAATQSEGGADAIVAELK